MQNYKEHQVDKNARSALLVFLFLFPGALTAKNETETNSSTPYRLPKLAFSRIQSKPREFLFIRRGTHQKEKIAGGRKNAELAVVRSLFNRKHFRSEKELKRQEYYMRQMSKVGPLPRLVYDLFLSQNYKPNTSSALYKDPQAMIPIIVTAMLSSRGKIDSGLQRFGYNMLVRLMQSPDVDIGNLGVEALAHSFPFVGRIERITDLEVRGEGIDNRGAIVLSKRLPTSLRNLRIAFTSMGSRGASEIVRAALQLPDLETLSLSDNKIGDDGAGAIISAFRGNYTLTVAP